MNPFLLAILAVCGGQAQSVSFDYDRSIPLDIQRKGLEERGTVRIEDISFRNLSGGRTGAYLVLPPGTGRTAVALFVHWYDPQEPTSNRTQFRDEAVELAGHGLMSLLVETPWSDTEFYPRRATAGSGTGFCTTSKS